MAQLRSRLILPSQVLPMFAAETFYYFAYGSCMCPVDLARSLGETLYPYVIGPAQLNGYRLGFYRRSRRRNCGALDIVPDAQAAVQGVLYCLPARVSDRLDQREAVPHNGYRREPVTVRCGDRHYPTVRTYVVVDKLPRELAPNDDYFQTVLRGAVTTGLPAAYCWQLFHHMHTLQQQAPEPVVCAPTDADGGAGAFSQQSQQYCFRSNHIHVNDTDSGIA
ncbi:MAG: gamma-glutamylcyclotransferase [Spirulinaceae cyanobacterium SM2_1_0]|nr:gamma-glutamylcyclotransferase [Spirulinaceae cyanobacterium SM2_1_0]